MNKFLRYAVLIIFIAVTSVFIYNPSKYMQSFFDGLTVWAINVLPALFPFMVITALFTKMLNESKHSVTGRLFGVSCDKIWILSLLCGYPVGAKSIADSGADKITATRMCSFCSTVGPIFLIATVGARLLSSNVAAVLLFSSQLIAVILNGMLYRNKDACAIVCNSSDTLKPSDVGDAVANSALSVISVGGLIALFYMLAGIVRDLLPSAWQSSLAFAFILGILEMTNGTIAVCELCDLFTATVLSSALLAFGGICVFFQCYSYLGKVGVRAKDVFKMKATQSALATISAYVLGLIFLK